MSPSLYCMRRLPVLFCHLAPLLYFSSSSYCLNGMKSPVFHHPNITLESLTPVPLFCSLEYRKNSAQPLYKPLTLSAGLLLRPSKSPYPHIFTTQHWLCCKDSLGLTAVLLYSFIGICSICPFIHLSKAFNFMRSDSLSFF